MQDDGQRSKTGLTASNLDLDARQLVVEHLQPAMQSNQRLGITAALLQV